MTAKYDDPTIIFNSSLLTYDGDRIEIAGAGDKPDLGKVVREKPTGRVVREKPKAR